MTTMKRARAFGHFLLLLPLFAASAAAQARLERIDWQAAPAEEKRPVTFREIRELKLEPYAKFPYKLRAVVGVRNGTRKQADALVLRYALSLHIVRASATADTGFWAVPFRTDEMRISHIDAGGVYDAQLTHFVLNEQLKKLNDTGFWVDAIRLQVMLDPRSGDDPAGIMREGVIGITRAADAPGGRTGK